MTQHHRSTAETIESEGSSSRHASRNSEPYLDPAPKHPLNRSPSPSHSTFADTTPTATRRRRRPEGASAADLETTVGQETTEDSKRKDAASAYKTSTLDKLEGWLGLTTGETSNPSSQSRLLDATLSQPAPRQQQRPKTSRTSKLVVVHAVAPTDTLDSLALRYKTDVRSLRRANGLWPGDSVLVRKHIYIPIDEDTGQEYSNIAQADEGLEGKLRLLDHQTGAGANGHLSSRPVSTTSTSSTSAASQAFSTLRPPKEVRRMPSEALSHFPPPGVFSATGKGKAREEEEAFGYAGGLKPGWDVDHGESGVDDLLQLAEKARSRGSSPLPDDQSAKPLQRLRTPPPDDMASVSPSSSFMALEEPWRPNKWTFGQKQTKRATNKARIDSLTGNFTEDATRLVDNFASAPAALMAPSSYRGWNDIPEPPLHRTAKGEVAHAYSGSSKTRRYPRPGMVDLVTPVTIIDDLAAGLPPNSGPASNWARPIAESVPLPGEAKTARSDPRTSHAQSSNLGWAQILSHTVRGKMGLEEALERGLEDIRILAGGANDQPSRVMLLRPGASSTPPPRPSAELARVSLAEGQSLAPSSTNGLEVRRSSGRSMHELEELAATQEDRRSANWSATWAAPARSGEGQGRRNIRNVDWLT